MDADWDELEGVIGGAVILAGGPGYEAARRPALARFADSRPEAVVMAATDDDVARTIGFARRNGLRATPRSGGHCFAGRSSSGDVVIDVSRMSAVSVSAGIATVGAGARLGDLHDTLAAYGRTIPAGSGVTVGIAGLTLGGGIGLLGRKYGLTCDHLRGARVVLADGRVVDCDEERDADLFWALRGAGGGQFGVVTSLVFGTVPAPMSTCFHLVWPPGAAAGVVRAWQTWAPSAPDDLEAHLRLTAAGGGPSPVVNLFGAMHGTEPETARLLAGFAALVGTPPESELRDHLPYREALRRLTGLGSAESALAEPERAHMFSRSEFFRRPLPDETVSALLSGLTVAPGEARELNFTALGGAYNRVPAGATAFPHRNEHFLLEHVTTAEPGVIGRAGDWVTGSWSLVRPWGSGGVYPNFPDPDLENGAEAYHGANLARLVRTKREYDTEGYFGFPGSLASD